MEIKIERDELFNAISRVQSIIEKRSNMPILSTVMISALESDINLTATDLEISFQQKLNAEVIESGNMTISGRKLFEIIKESKSQMIHIKEKENASIIIQNVLHYTSQKLIEQQAKAILRLHYPESPTFMEFIRDFKIWQGVLRNYNYLSLVDFASIYCYNLAFLFSKYIRSWLKGKP